MPKIDDKKIIFIHIPKTGGSYIDTNILNIDILNITNDIQQKYFVGVNNKIHYSHMTINEISQLIDITKYNYVFTMVRNPYDRLVSNYFFNGYVLISKNFNSFVYDLYDYVINDKDIFLNDTSDIIKKTLHIHYRINQVDFLKKNNMIYNKIKVFKYEKFKESINTIISDLKLDIKYDNNKINNSEHENYKSYYNKETADIVYKLYQPDFEYFGYEKMVDFNN